MIGWQSAACGIGCADMPKPDVIGLVDLCELFVVFYNIGQVAGNCTRLQVEFAFGTIQCFLWR